ncbi:uncharacterized protein LOC123505788 isoform X2 [Portunus trituberculatus]|uniref:uncharacterized protein LOC123505788 isoform X2 n=1 Tax=Portunus trituberculatus TaxID=210409 RepID=UPI001E1CD281|nr:uncharacterized protein LOC123505788 isoform X2 [Portunus trituberculatus]
MWSDNAHSEGFHHAHPFPHAPALDKLCLHSRLGCVLAGGLRSSSKAKGESGSSFLAQLQDAPSAPTATEISAEAAVFVAVIVVFYAAIIVILLGTNMRRPRSPSSRQRRSRSRSRSRHRHEVVLDPENGGVATKHTQKKKKREVDGSGVLAESV